MTRDNPPAQSAHALPHIYLIGAAPEERARIAQWLADRFVVLFFDDAASALQAAEEALPAATKALQAAEEALPALVVFDADAIAGDDARLLRDSPLFSAVPFILLSSDEPAEDTGEYLLKPYTARELRACVDSQLRLARLRQEMAQALRASEERYRAIVEGQSEMVNRFRPDGTLLFVNGAYARARGATPEDLTGANFWDWIEEDDRPAVRAMLARITPENPEIRIENRFEMAGGVRWTLWTNRGLAFDENGRATELQSTGIDITDRKRAEEALRQSEQRFRLMADAAPVKIWISDHEKRCTWVNEKWLQFVGRPLDEVVGLGWLQDLHPIDRELVADAYYLAFDAREPFSLEYRLRRKDGEYRWIVDNGIPLYTTSGEFRGYIGSAIDIHDRKEAEQALRHINETLEERVEQRTRQVRQLLARLTMAEQEERRHVSQILHDDLQQLLYGIEMKMAVIEQDLQDAGYPALLQELDEARGWIGQAIATTRHLTVDLSPPILQNEGLADALQWLQTQMRELHGLDVRLEAEHSFYLPDHDLRVLLFHVVRELLFNVKKHAGINKATVRLRERDNHLIIEVLDEGRGFNTGALGRRASQTGGFGLFSIRERLKLLGGQLDVHSHPGKGTRIQARLPLVEEKLSL